MDEDVASMSREQLIEEVRKLRRGIRTHRDSTVTTCAGTTPHSGVSCPTGRIRFRPYLSGQNSCVGASNTASPSTNRHQTPRVHRSRTSHRAEVVPRQMSVQLSVLCRLI